MIERKFDFGALSNEDLIEKGDSIAELRDCDEKRAYNFELATRCKRIYEKSGKEPSKLKIEELSVSDGNFISAAYNVLF